MILLCFVSLRNHGTAVSFNFQLSGWVYFTVLSWLLFSLLATNGQLISSELIHLVLYLTIRASHFHDVQKLVRFNKLIRHPTRTQA